MGAVGEIIGTTLKFTIYNYSPSSLQGLRRSSTINGEINRQRPTHSTFRPVRFGVSFHISLRQRRRHASQTRLCSRSCLDHAKSLWCSFRSHSGFQHVCRSPDELLARCRAFYYSNYWRLMVSHCRYFVDRMRLYFHP